MEQRFIDSFWDKIDRTGDCWIWTRSTSRGYGMAWTGQHTILAHRLAFILTNGTIPSGLELDHVCHSNDLTCAGGESCPHRRCVNPAHLEPVTTAVNVRRGRGPQSVYERQRSRSHCIHGHCLSGRNLYITPDGRRQCRTCNAARSAKCRAR